MSQESTANLSLDDSTVLAYLQADPSFFTRHPALLVDLTIPSPHGEGVISLSTKQIGLLRAQLEDKSKLLEDLIGFGNANDEINAHIHQLSLALIPASDTESVQTILDMHVKQAFGLTHASLHLLETFSSLPENFISWLNALSKPYCNGSNAAIETLIESQHLSPTNGSFSVIPMRDTDNNTVVACIVLAAKAPQHFTQQMETDFLVRIGELFCARLATLDTH